MKGGWRLRRDLDPPPLPNKGHPPKLVKIDQYHGKSYVEAAQSQKKEKL